MTRSLTKLLEEIGAETYEIPYVDASHTIRPITRDQALARQIWRRALGYEEETKNTDGTVRHIICPPDPKMQQFIIERREGKIVQPPDEKSITALERIDELVKQQLNAAAKQVVDNDRDDSQTDSE